MRTIKTRGAKEITESDAKSNDVMEPMCGKADLVLLGPLG